MGRRSAFVPELPCERLVVMVCGEKWRNLDGRDLDAAWGVAIVKSVLDGVTPDIGVIAAHLGVDRNDLYDAWRRLNLNGAIAWRNLDPDRAGLQRGDRLAWSYYAGCAAGAAGPYAGVR